MALIVQKFGGTSVGDADRIKAVADHVARTRAAGNDVVVVVSAMGKFTDDLIGSPTTSRRRGRRVNSTCCSPRASGSRWRSSRWPSARAAWSRPPSPGARPASSPTPITPAPRSSRCVPTGFARRSTPVWCRSLPGFKGVSTERDITTLGRGGSDVTAVALAAALKADVCEIYTDVTGVFSADPRVVVNARRIPKVSFDEMMEISRPADAS